MEKAPAGGGEERSVEILRREAAANPDDVGLRMRLGQLCLQQAYVVLGAPTVYEEAARCARDAFREAVALEPDNADAWYQLGFALEYLEEGDEALAAYTRAQQVGGGMQEARLARGRLLARLGRREEAAEVLEGMLSAEALYERGKLAAAGGDLERAVKLLAQAVARDPYYGEAWLNLARVRYRLGDEEAGRQAEARFEELRTSGMTLSRLETLARARPDEPEVWKRLGVAWLRRGRPREAAFSLRRARALRPEDRQAGLFLARALMEGGRWAEAEAILRPMAEASGADPNPSIYLAAALREQGKIHRAFEVLQAAEARHPNNPYILQNLAMLSRDLGKMEEAAHYASRARAVGAAGRPRRAP